MYICLHRNNTYRAAFGRGFGRSASDEGANPSSGAVIYYWLKDKPNSDVTLEFLDGNGKLIRKISSKPAKKEQEQGSEEDEGEPRRGGRDMLAPAEKGPEPL